MYILTIDTGTTNSRVTLWKENIVIDKAAREVGVRDTAIDGHNQRLKTAVKNAIDDVLARNSITMGEITRILASGMITSNVGLTEVPHLTAPVAAADLAAGMVEKQLPDVSEKGIWFVPGVKNGISPVTIDNCEEMDIMRGEEAETFGLAERLHLQGPAVIILPGSHTKFVALDEQNQITGCLTSLAGELLSVITHHTIIANALDKSFASQFDKEMVQKGYETSKRAGLNRTCFTIRILDQFTGLTVNQKANFLLGAVLADDIRALKESCALRVSPDSQIVIAGKDMLRDAFAAVLETDGYFSRVTVADDDHLRDLAGFGVIHLASLGATS